MNPQPQQARAPELLVPVTYGVDDGPNDAPAHAERHIMVMAADPDSPAQLAELSDLERDYAREGYTTTRRVSQTTGRVGLYHVLRPGPASPASTDVPRAAIQAFARAIERRIAAHDSTRGKGYLSTSPQNHLEKALNHIRPVEIHIGHLPADVALDQLADAGAYLVFAAETRGCFRDGGA